MKGKHHLLLVLGLLTIVGLLSSCDKSLTSPPVEVKVRESRLGEGLVLRITNASSHHLYNVKVIGRNFDEISSASVIAAEHLRPYATVEVGWLEFEGWVPISGETYEIYADDYLAPYICTLP